ncbi:MULTISPECIES: DNA topoisomerase IB [Brucella]|uniref:DNA topoisomerase IB n=1 Tax=Brucella TaxID=234 RepID=UPI0022316775|nr:MULTISPECIES: DNA topoisomerase IB [Brucella/Ochrobactrum group]NIH75103.1 DNA topoisomerase-1 [Ochrobactrum sp. P20RRXII]UZD67881.1 DNA topoisomerase IB [Brucella sp. JSBI001]
MWFVVVIRQGKYDWGCKLLKKSSAVPLLQNNAAHELVHVSDTAPGIRRLRCGARFRYVRFDKKAISVADRNRIAKLAIPPAWNDVWICCDQRGHIQATGRDTRGRKQYRYHSAWMAMQEETKFSSLPDFAGALSRLRKVVDIDMRRRSLCREKVVATVIWLMDRLLLRVGNPDYARDNKSFGVTTLRNRHLRDERGGLRLAFTGKSGKMWSLKLSDKRIARIIRSIQELPGQQLFQYIDGAGDRCPVSSQDINDYLRVTMRSDFTSKHFRTWAATATALELLRCLDLPDSDRAQKQRLNSAIDKVAHMLGNTRTVCRQSYIHPAIPEHWLAGKLGSQIDAAGAIRLVAPELSDAERRTLKWLLFIDAEKS